jgi:hypothetical protein
MSFGEIVFALVMSGILGLWLYGIIITDGDTIRRILWDDTMLGWGWRKLFGEKKKAKQAPIPSFQSMPAPPVRRLTAKKAAPKGFSTSSLNIPPTANHIGKPLVIKNWDRLAGLSISVLGRRWFVVGAVHTLSGYECTMASSSTTYTITFCIYGDMYDSHRISVFCKGRTAIMDVSVCKHPNLLLEKIVYEFSDKFDV